MRLREIDVIAAHELLDGDFADVAVVHAPSRSQRTPWRSAPSATVMSWIESSSKMPDMIATPPASTERDPREGHECQLAEVSRGEQLSRSHAPGRGDAALRLAVLEEDLGDGRAVPTSPRLPPAFFLEARGDRLHLSRAASSASLRPFFSMRPSPK